jgi:hypothetical protein
MECELYLHEKEYKVKGMGPRELQTILSSFCVVHKELRQLLQYSYTILKTKDNVLNNNQINFKWLKIFFNYYKKAYYDNNIADYRYTISRQFAQLKDYKIDEILDRVDSIILTTKRIFNNLNEISKRISIPEGEEPLPILPVK